MRRRYKPPKGEKHSEYHRIWRIVDGVMNDIFLHHPEYVPNKYKAAARLSVVKRVAGAIAGRSIRADHRVACRNGPDDAHCDQRFDGASQEAT